MSAIKSDTRELDYRCNGGIEVTLEWISSENLIAVTVVSATANFTLFPDNGDALDCYRHPFAYIGKCYGFGQFRGEHAHLAESGIPL